MSHTSKNIIYLCKISCSRQEEAAINGVLPPLQVPNNKHIQSFRCDLYVKVYIFDYDWRVAFARLATRAKRGVLPSLQVPNNKLIECVRCDSMLYICWANPDKQEGITPG